MRFPAMVQVTQQFDRTQVMDPAATVRQELERLGIHGMVRPGARIAITAGSRGIRNNVPMLRAVADSVRRAGGEPFIVGAMGSHGGGTADGQMAVLESLGVTEAAMGCPVLASAEVVELGRTAEGLGVYCDANAYHSDGIILLNRVKPHTSFTGSHESGLMKIAAIGLGKAPGATQIHGRGAARMADSILSVARVLLMKAPIIAGIGVVENGFEETARVVAFRPDELEAGEAGLLAVARRFSPRLPMTELDLLVVEAMGKDYSGTGIDTNVIGRMRMFGVDEPASPRIARIAVLDLTDASHGNATGIGLADVTTARLEAKVDRHATYLNCITSTNVQRAFLPIVAPTDREAVTLALRSLGLADAAHARVARIPNTLELERLWVSEPVAAELRGRPSLSAGDEAHPLAFDDAGNLLPAVPFGARKG